MKKILVIGNSFSEDATKYLHSVAKAAGIDTKVVNLYIGGCPLERHWENIQRNNAIYQYQLNGTITERKVSIEEILKEDTWDYIVTQQCSFDSGWHDSYEPFLGMMLDYIKKMSPTAELLLQETWAYEIDSQHPKYPRYHKNQQEMYERLRDCYRDMAKKYNLRLIPSGDVIQYVRGMEPFHVQKGGISLCRDGHHMTFLYGRYLLACVWAKTLFQIPLTTNSYVPHSVALSETADIDIVKKIRQLTENYLSEM